MAYSFVWPAGLPQLPTIEGYSDGPRRNVLRSPVSVGPAKVRDRGTMAEIITAAYIMTPAQELLLIEFLTDTISTIGRFGWPRPPAGTLEEVKLVVSEEGRLFEKSVVTGIKSIIRLTLEVPP